MRLSAVFGLFLVNYCSGALMINITNLSVHYRESLALDKVSVFIEEGELIAVVGPNGAGKSTLLKSIMQQLKLSTGCIDLGHRCLKDIAYLPQSHQIDRQFPITVREFVSAGSWQRISFWRAFGCTEQRLLQEALQKVNLIGVDDRQISTLSGGQFQRMLFARMLMQDADILLLDEPFNAIDAQTTEDLMTVIHDCQRKGKTILAVIHDLALVRRFFPNVMLIATQLIASGTTETVMTGENLAKAGYQYLSSEMQPLNTECSVNSLSPTELPFYGRNIS
ncbi:ABC transporter ATP-binding protein [Photobacterium frigidiphilum]|uniref:ABC transporter ATP-binding protein n=2 Tax=Photobacterium frigidiphilum TaxID=264736 RepID=A0A2T3J904_9GAMM|nr:ABC transporter ATP-binding protein [Photobacterium frigidiphilum]